MAWNGSGLFQRLYNWVDDKNALVPITASRMDAEMDGMATGISNCIAKDGQNTATANLPMGGYSHTNVGNATTRTQYAAAGQIQDGALVYVVDSGAADAYVVALSPSISAYAAGLTIRFKATNANTGASTINVNSVGLKTIKKNGITDDLEAGDIQANEIVTIIYDGVSGYFQLQGRPDVTGQITGGASTIVTSDLTASRALVSNGSGKVAVSSVTSTEIGYVSGVTSALQTQMDAKAPLASPALTGNPTAPTQSPSDNSTKIATTAYVDDAIGKYTSSNQTITLGGGLTLAHSLGSTPSNVTLDLECTSNDSPFSVGDTIQFGVSHHSTAGANNLGIRVTKDATNVYIRFGSSASLLSTIDNSGNLMYLTYTKWQLIVRAYK